MTELWGNNNWLGRESIAEIIIKPINQQDSCFLIIEYRIEDSPGIVQFKLNIFINLWMCF